MQARGIAFLLVVLALAIGSAFFMRSKPVSYGLDVVGGVRFTYQMDTSKLTAEQRQQIPEMQTKMLRILSNRASGAVGVAEPSISAKGVDQFVIELPGFTNQEEARSILSNTAKVIVYWARNVSTERRESRRYSEAGSVEVAGVEYVAFSNRSGKKLEPGMPEYAEMIEGWEVILEGEDVAGATPLILGPDTARPTFTFSDDGARKLEAWTRRYTNQREKIAFVLDNKVLNIAPLADGAILTTNAEIQGSFPAKYVQQLTELIRAGSLPVPLIELESQKVDPTIGSEALSQMVRAGAISLGIIAAFLIVYYGFAGIIAALAMVLYGLFTLSVLNGIGATFSLAAIAAFILSAGMAVDANILVFERLKEEIRAGRELMKAIDISFKRAFSAIIDSNIATVLTCGVLFWFGTGPVKGFASTLAIGVIVSFFTAFIVTRAIITGLLGIGIGHNTKWYGLNRNWFGEHLEHKAGEKPLNIVGRSKFYFAISAILILPGLIAVAAGGIKPNVEFQGGLEASYLLPQGKTAAEIREGLEKAGVRGPNVKFAESEKGRIVYVTIPPTEGFTKSDPETKQRVGQAIGITTPPLSFSAVGPTIQRETVTNAINAVLVASGLILLYLAVRFGVAVGGFKNGIKFGISAVIALLHDVLFVIGTAGIVGILLGWEISGLFITALLTVIGFSVHDTIIIFDRIRENLRKPNQGETFAHLCDKSVSQSIARSINTSMTAVVPLILLIAIGTPTPELKFMCLSMLLGISIGAFSSIFNATPILYLWNQGTIRRQGEQAGLLAEAQRELKLRAQMATAEAAGLVPGAVEAPTAAGYGQIKRRSSAPGTTRRDDEE